MAAERGIASVLGLDSLGLCVGIGIGEEVREIRVRARRAEKRGSGGVRWDTRAVSDRRAIEANETIDG